MSKERHGQWQDRLRRYRRALRQLWIRDVRPTFPSAPLSWRYLLPGQSERVRLHRRLWWHSRYRLPALLWLPLEFLRWLHWRCWAAPRRLRAAVAECGAGVEARFGVSVEAQTRRLRHWANAWCIDPYAGYDWRLYREGVDGLAIIYSRQAAAYHSLQNRQTGATRADYRLLADKRALAEHLSAQGIPVAGTECVSRGDWRDLLRALDRHGGVFCKLRSGNRGESAFAVSCGEPGWQGLTHAGAVLADQQATQAAWQRLADKGEVLVQPLLKNHAALAPASVSEAAISLRIVTRSGPGGVSVWWAELQVPGVAVASGSRGFWRYPVSIVDGSVSVLGGEWFLRKAWRDEYAAIGAAVLRAERVPYWADAARHSCLAHGTLPRLWAVAWDWVVTPDGPMALEGNSGWDLDQVQQQGGDLVSVALGGAHVSQ